MRRYIFVLFIGFFLVSCEYFKQDPPGVPVARVNESYLYDKDIQQLVTETTSKEDSILIVNNYITRWATQQLLIDKAKVNLSRENLDTYERLVNDYKNGLYTEAYKNKIVLSQLDSSITENQFKEFYEANKENFKLNDELVKVRYLQVDPNYSELAKTKEQLQRFNTKDIAALRASEIKFKSFNFNDSVWIRREALVEAIPALKGKTDDVLKKSNFTQLQDSLGVYLVKIQDVLQPNDIAPLSYVKPTIRQILLNKKKLELIKELEKDITKDAIKNNDFEIY